MLHDVHGNVINMPAVNDTINFNKGRVSDGFQTDMLFYQNNSINRELTVGDFKVFYNPMNLFDCAVWFTDKCKNNEFFIRDMGSDEPVNIVFVEKIARRISLEMFNPKLNRTAEEIQLRVVRKFIEEYLDAIK